MPGQNEVALLRDQITEEVNRDAEVIGNQLFGQSPDAREPDIAHVSEATLEQRYRQAFLAQDREYLGTEAQRDPQQFMRIAQSIGVVHPDNLPPTLQPPAGQNPIEAATPLAALPPPVPSLAPPPAAAPPIQPAPSLPSGGPLDPALVQAALAAAQQQQAAPPTPQPPPTLPPGL
jgi:hypothetical protein